MRSPGYSDQELLNGLISRDEKVLKKFYSLYYQHVRQFVRSNNGSDEDARDLFQDAMLVLYQKAKDHKFKLTCSPGTYLYSVSRFLWLKELAKRKWTSTRYVEMEDVIDTDDDIGILNEKNERLIFFRKCFEKLPEDCKKVLGLFTKGLSIAQITGIMGYGSEQYTRNRRYRCKATLINIIKALYE